MKESKEGQYGKRSRIIYYYSFFINYSIINGQPIQDFTK